MNPAMRSIDARALSHRTYPVGEEVCQHLQICDSPRVGRSWGGMTEISKYRWKLNSRALSSPASVRLDAADAAA